MKKIILTIVVLMFILSPSAAADVYSEQFELSGAEELNDSLPDGVRSIFDELEIDITKQNWVDNINAGNVFTIIKEFITDGGKTPLKSGVSVIALILVNAAFLAFCGERMEVKGTALYVSSLSVSAVALLPLFSVITASARSVRAGAQFMLSFVPVYGTVLFASGKPITGAASGSLLLAASEGMVQLSTHVLSPLIGSYLAVCICSSVSPVINGSGISELIKKAANWIIGLISTVYLGILSVQTTVNASADTLAVKTGKFVIGSFIPVVGGIMSETLTTVQSCMSLLKTSVGIYGVVVVALIMLPVIIELLLWRLMLLCSSSVASVFECGGICTVLKAADAAVSFLVGIILICALAFIISITVIFAAGG